jgi:hypothetical protein
LRLEQSCAISVLNNLNEVALANAIASTRTRALPDENASATAPNMTARVRPGHGKP